MDSLSRRAALPFDFDMIKVIFDTSSMGSLSLNSHINTIQLITIPTLWDDFSALTLTLNTFALYKSTLRRFGKGYYNTYPIVQFSANTSYVRPLRFPIQSGSARFRFPCRAYHLCKSFVSSFKELTIFVPCGNSGHTTIHNNGYTQFGEHRFVESFGIFG